MNKSTAFKLIKEQFNLKKINIVEEDLYGNIIIKIKDHHYRLSDKYSLYKMFEDKIKHPTDNVLEIEINGWITVIKDIHTNKEFHNLLDGTLTPNEQKELNKILSESNNIKKQLEEHYKPLGDPFTFNYNIDLNLETAFDFWDSIYVYSANDYNADGTSLFGKAMVAALVVYLDVYKSLEPLIEEYTDYIISCGSEYLTHYTYFNSFMELSEKDLTFYLAMIDYPL